MPKEKLKKSVEELRSELSLNQNLEPSQQEELSDLAGRLDAMLRGDTDHWEERLVDTMEQKLLEYEQEHPVVGRIMREIVTTLSNIGV